MKKYAFDNKNFDTWLYEKTLEIISRDLEQPISNRDTLVLILKSQLQSLSNISDAFNSVRTSKEDI